MGSSTEHSGYGPTANPWDLHARAGWLIGWFGCGGRVVHRACRDRYRHRWLDPSACRHDRHGRARNPPTAASAATASSRSLHRSTRSGRFSRDVRDAALLLGAVAGRDERDSTSARLAVPDFAAALPAADDEAAGALRGLRLGLPRQYFVEGMEPGVELRVREAVAALRTGRGAGHRRGHAAHRLRPRDLLHHRPGRGLGQPGALRRHPLRARRSRWRRDGQLPRHA